jgi:hypothetical protein
MNPTREWENLNGVHDLSARRSPHVELTQTRSIELSVVTQLVKNVIRKGIKMSTKKECPLVTACKLVLDNTVSKSNSIEERLALLDKEVATLEKDLGENNDLIYSLKQKLQKLES